MRKMLGAEAPPTGVESAEALPYKEVDTFSAVPPPESASCCDLVKRRRISFPDLCAMAAEIVPLLRLSPSHALGLPFGSAVPSS